MAMSYKRRRGLALLVLVVGLPVYIVLVVSMMGWIGRLPVVLEMLVYVALGVLWVLPLKAVFKGIGKVDPGGDMPE